ncbi:MAG: DUF3261 domain-containing protein [Cellvibrionaceae bacterium]
MKCLPVVAIVCVFLLAACSTLKGAGTLPPLPLLPPADLGKHVQLSQRVMVTFADQSQTFLGAWVASAERLDFVGLTPSGQRLLSLSYDSQHFSEHYSSLMEDPIPGREVLSHLQLANWPRASIERQLEMTDWRLAQSDGERRLYFKDNLILTITASYTEDDDGKLPAAIRIRSHVAPYVLEVETLQVVEK